MREALAAYHDAACCITFKPDTLAHHEAAASITPIYITIADHIAISFLKFCVSSRHKTVVITIGKSWKHIEGLAYGAIRVLARIVIIFLDVSH